MTMLTFRADMEFGARIEGKPRCTTGVATSLGSHHVDRMPKRNLMA